MENILPYGGNIIKFATLAKELNKFIPKLQFFTVESEYLEMKMQLSDCLNFKLKFSIDAAIVAIKN